jgi:hypothetical protein
MMTGSHCQGKARSAAVSSFQSLHSAMTPYSKMAAPSDHIIFRRRSGLMVGDYRLDAGKGEDWEVETGGRLEIGISLRGG